MRPHPINDAGAFSIILSNQPPINEWVDQGVMLFPDHQTIDDNPLLRSIVLPSPHQINDFSDWITLLSPHTIVEYRSVTELFSPPTIKL